MTHEELAGLHEMIDRAFERLRLGQLAHERIGLKPDGPHSPVLPMQLANAVGLVRNEVHGLIDGAIGREAR